MQSRNPPVLGSSRQIVTRELCGLVEIVAMEQDYLEAVT